MYCHTAKERSEWLRGNIALFKKVKEILCSALRVWVPVRTIESMTFFF